ncbi:MAG: SgcJ/EcaC family oxidoreductase [Saprospiraceae bacterium]
MEDLKAIFFDSPEQMPELFAQFWNQRDAQSLAGLFADDAEFVNVVGLWWHDRQAIFKAHDYGLKVIFKDSNLIVREKRTKKLANDILIVQARFVLENQTPKENVPNPGKRMTVFSFVVQKFKGGFQCVLGHNTDRIQGMETHVVDEDGKLLGTRY